MSASIYMALVGYGVLVGIPVISTAWVTLLGFSEVQVGRVAGADLGGLSLGAIMTATVIAKIDRRLLILIGAALAIVANVACIFIFEYQHVLWLRLLAGIGSGIYTAVAVATLGGGSKPARAFNILLFAFAFSQALELYALPKLSINGIYMVFIGAYLIGLMFINWIPAHPPAKLNNKNSLEHDHKQQSKTPKVPAYLPWLVLAAMVATYINIGAYWTYIELASLDSEATPEWVSKVLIWASFCSIVGCLVATVFSKRYGLARPLLVTLVIQAIIVAMLAGGINNINIVISMFMFNFLWIFIDVYQMATIANIDRSGKFAALMPGAQGLGQILGANIAASVLGFGLGYSGVFIMCALASLSAMLIYLLMYLRLKKVVPALADAS